MEEDDSGQVPRLGYSVAEGVKRECDIGLLLLKLPDIDCSAFPGRLTFFPYVGACRFRIVVSLDDFNRAIEVSAERRVILVLAGNRVVGLGERLKNRSSEILYGGSLKCESDWLPILFEQNGAKNAFDQGADIEPFVWRVLETTVVQVVPVDVNACS